MIIDIHTHTFPQKIAQTALRSMQQNCHTALFSDGTESGLIKVELRARVDLAVIQPVATNPIKVSHLNDSVIAATHQSQGIRVISFGAMHPACSYWEQEIERLKAAGVVGIKLHPPYAKVDIDDPRSISILKKCKDMDMVVLIHSGKDVGLPGASEALPIKIRHAIDAVGPMKLIAAHMGGWGCWEDAERLLSGTGIYFDTAFSLGAMTPAADNYKWNKNDLQLLTHDKFCELIQAFEVDHVLFGTDSPWADPEQELKKIKEIPLPEEEIELILGQNARQLLPDVSTRISDGDLLV